MVWRRHLRFRNRSGYRNWRCRRKGFALAPARARAHFWRHPALFRRPHRRPRPLERHGNDQILIRQIRFQVLCRVEHVPVASLGRRLERARRFGFGRAQLADILPLDLRDSRRTYRRMGLCGHPPFRQRDNSRDGSPHRSARYSFSEVVRTRQRFKCSR